MQTNLDKKASSGSRPYALRDRLISGLGFILISVCMSGVMFAVMVALNTGLTREYLKLWLSAWEIGAVVSAPTAAIVIPPIVRWQNSLRSSG